jgi:cell division protein FtsQ
MDGRGRPAEPVTDGAPPRRFRLRRGTTTGRFQFRSFQFRSKLPQFLRRWSPLHFLWTLPRGAGVAAAALLLLGSLGFGAVRGGHLPAVLDELAGLRDALANAAGFRITSIALSGEHYVTREEILTTAGVTGRSSLLFLDATEARIRLKTNPWIAEATVLKLYPGRLHIAVTERAAFALWQRDGKVMVIADDGTVVEPYVPKRFADLPLVVGRGAQLRAKDFLALLDTYPLVRKQLQAAVLIAERRWNLRLKNGLDVRLPEEGIARALDTLVRLDRDKALLSRDLIVLDLRLADRVTVRLSDEAAQARADALKPQKPKKKAGDT